MVSQVGQGHYYDDYGGRIFKQSAEQLSRNVGAWPKKLCENPRTPVETWIVSVMSPNCFNSHPKRQDKKTMLHLSQNSPMSLCLILDLQKHLLQRTMMVMRTQPNLSCTVAVHIGNGDLSTKCLVRNLTILW